LVNVYEARGQFSKLLDEAEAGEEIIIARNGTPVVRLVPVTPPKRRLGRWRSHVPNLSDAEWEAADQAVAELFDTALK
jgi:prevent-host-death family protein